MAIVGGLRDRRSVVGLLYRLVFGHRLSVSRRGAGAPAAARPRRRVLARRPASAGAGSARQRRTPRHDRRSERRVVESQINRALAAVRETNLAAARLARGETAGRRWRTSPRRRCRGVRRRPSRPPLYPRIVPRGSPADSASNRRRRRRQFRLGPQRLLPRRRSGTRAGGSTRAAAGRGQERARPSDRRNLPRRTRVRSTRIRAAAEPRRAAGPRRARSAPPQAAEPAPPAQGRGPAPGGPAAGRTPSRRRPRTGKEPNRRAIAETGAACRAAGGGRKNRGCASGCARRTAPHRQSRSQVRRETRTQVEAKGPPPPAPASLRQQRQMSSGGPRARAAAVSGPTSRRAKVADRTRDSSRWKPKWRVCSDAKKAEFDRAGRRPRPPDAFSLVAVDFLAPFVPLLRLDRKRGDRARVETAKRDRIACLAAIAVTAVLDTRERGLDLADHFALPVARPQFYRPVGLRRRPIGDIGMIFALVL